MVGNKSDNSSNSSGVAKSFRKAAPYLNISYTLIGSIAMLGVLGWYLDKQFNTNPCWTVIGILSGLFIGFYNMFKIIKGLEKKK